MYRVLEWRDGRGTTGWFLIEGEDDTREQAERAAQELEEASEHECHAVSESEFWQASQRH